MQNVTLASSALCRNAAASRKPRVQNGALVQGWPHSAPHKPFLFRLILSIDTHEWCRDNVAQVDSFSLEPLQSNSLDF